MAPRGTIWGSICIVVTLSDKETIWTKFGQNPGFSLRNSVSLSLGLDVKFYHVLCKMWLYVYEYKVKKFGPLYSLLLE